VDGFLMRMDDEGAAASAHQTDIEGLLGHDV
jgi:hypothetical protein